MDLFESACEVAMICPNIVGSFDRPPTPVITSPKPETRFPPETPSWVESPRFPPEVLLAQREVAPVGPQKMKEAMGLLGFCRPALARRTAFAMAVTASS